MLTTCASRTEHGRPYLGRGLTARAACLGALLTQRPRMDARVWTSRLRGACHRSLSCVLCCVVGWGGRRRRNVRDACELEQERARTLHPYDHSNFSRAMLEGLFHEIPLPRASCAAGARILL